jgi:hypothetical protein
MRGDIYFADLNPSRGSEYEIMKLHYLTIEGMPD